MNYIYIEKLSVGLNNLSTTGSEERLSRNGC